MTTQLRFLMAAALLSGALVAGCAQGEPEGTVTSSTSPTPPFTTTTPEPTKPAGEVTLTGTVERIDLEGGCTVLRADTNKSYELKGGDPNVLKAGSRVIVKGKIRTDLMTVCQMGPVLEVLSSQPA